MPKKRLTTAGENPLDRPCQGLPKQPETPHSTGIDLSITKLGHKDGRREICPNQPHAKKLPATPRSAGKDPLEYQTWPKGWVTGEIYQPATRPKLPETPLSAGTDPFNHQLGRKESPGRYDSTGHTPKTARDASLGGQRPTQSTNLGIKMGLGRYV